MIIKTHNIYRGSMATYDGFKFVSAERKECYSVNTINIDYVLSDQKEKMTNIMLCQ